MWFWLVFCCYFYINLKIHKKYSTYIYFIIIYRDIYLKSNENGFLSFTITCLNFKKENINNFEITSIKVKLLLYIRNKNDHFRIYSKGIYYYFTNYIL